MYDPYEDVWNEQEERLLDLCDRIKQYTCASEYQRHIIINPGYIDGGITDLENYLTKHAAFEAFMSERSNNA